MTGFGRARGPVGQDWDAEIFARGVNSRFLDLAVQTRESETVLEAPLRRVFARHLHRGKVEVGLRLKRRRPAAPEVAVDERLLDALLSKLQALSERYPVDARLTARDLLAVPQRDFLAIVAGAGAVDDEEIALVEDEQEMVPDALAIMHALVPLGAKQPDPGGIERARRRHRHKIRPFAQRHEALAAERMPFEGLQHRLAQRLCPEQADHRGPAALRHIHLGKRVVAHRMTLVDVDPDGRVAGLDHAAERREGHGGQRLGGEFAHRPCSIIVSVIPAKAGIPLCSRIFAR